MPNDGRDGQNLATFYHSDESERLALAPLYKEFLRRGWRVQYSKNLAQPSTIGVFAIHSNLLYDFDAERWTKPNCAFSAVILHDLYQDNGSGPAYFRTDSWEVFDLGIVPGQRWVDIACQAEAQGLPGPRLGVRVGGWPKAESGTPADSGSSDPAQSPCPRILVGASWQGRQVVADIEEAMRGSDVEVLIKFARYYDEIDADNPWFEILSAQTREARLASELADRSRVIRRIPEDTPIFDALRGVDVVVSNGSNVMFEGLLVGKPAICVSDWYHPSGRLGEALVSPKVSFPGVINGSARQLKELIALALTPECRTVARAAGESLVAPDLAGRSARASVDWIIQGFEDGSPVPAEPAQSQPSVGGVPSEILETQKRLAGRADELNRAEQRDLGAELVTAVNQLRVYEGDIAHRDIALAEADERIRALASQVQQLTEENSVLQRRYDFVSQKWARWTLQKWRQRG